MGIVSPRVSIIIPSYKSRENLKKCLQHCLKLNYDDFEIIVAGNIDPLMSSNNIVWLIVDDESQGCKRNAAIAKARGEICAFIDDDAFPHRDWLRNSMKYFQDSGVGAVSGPGIAPNDESFMERGSSAVLASYLGTGPARCRYTPCTQRIIQDAAPAYNLLVRRDLLLETGGFPTGIRAAEDTILSAKIRSQGKKILYANDVIVYHKRRPLFVPLARQIGIYALHRGFLSKEHKGLRNLVFILFPIIVVAFFVAVLVLFGRFSYFALPLVGMPVLIYLGASYLSGLATSRSGSVAVLAMFGIPLVHLTYVAQFFRGLATKQLDDKPSY